MNHHRFTGTLPLIILCLILLHVQEVHILARSAKSGNYIDTSNYTSNYSTMNTLLVNGLRTKILRFHIVADSDTPEAQAVKLQVRDCVIAYLTPLLEDVTGKEEAVELLSKNLESLEQISNQVLQKNTLTYSAAVSLTEKTFPQKTYNQYTFPAGVYDALCITLGTGQGENWWCLAFPRLCFTKETYDIVPDETEEQLKYLLTDEEYENILKQDVTIKVKFKFIEWIKERFSWNKSQNVLMQK